MSVIVVLSTYIEGLFREMFQVFIIVLLSIFLLSDHHNTSNWARIRIVHCRVLSNESLRSSFSDISSIDFNMVRGLLRRQR